MEGRLGALLAIPRFWPNFDVMRRTNPSLTLWMASLLGVAAGCGGCGEGNSGPPQVRIDEIEVVNFDAAYIQDPWAEEGGPDFYFSVSVSNDLYWDSEQSVEMNASTPLRIPTDGLTFAGGELDETVTIVLWDADAQDDPISGDDYVGEVSFVPRDLMSSEPVRHPLEGDALEIALLLAW